MTKRDIMAAIEREAAYRAAVETQRLARLAQRDALSAIARDIPDPETFARQLPLWAAEALLTATMGHAGWRVSQERAVWLRPMGLVDAGTGIRELSVFGCAVRKALKEEDA